MVEVLVDFDYDAAESDELTIKVGEVIKNVTIQDGGWWEGELRGKRGVFPDNFVKVVKKEEKKDEAIIKEGPVVAELKNKLSSKQVSTKTSNVKRVDAASKKKVFAKTRFSYQPANSDELRLNVGDIVEVIDKEEEGWWSGSLNGCVGVFPSNFVEIITDEKSEPDNCDNKEKEKFHEIKGKKVMGVGLGNIFEGQNIKLKTSGSKKDETPKASAESSSPVLPPRPGKPHLRGHSLDGHTFLFDQHATDVMKLNITPRGSSTVSKPGDVAIRQMQPLPFLSELKTVLSLKKESSLLSVVSSDNVCKRIRVTDYPTWVHISTPKRKCRKQISKKPSYLSSVHVVGQGMMKESHLGQFRPYDVEDSVHRFGRGEGYDSDFKSCGETLQLVDGLSVDIENGVSDNLRFDIKQTAQILDQVKGEINIIEKNVIDNTIADDIVMNNPKSGVVSSDAAPVHIKRNASEDNGAEFESLNENSLTIKDDESSHHDEEKALLTSISTLRFYDRIDEMRKRNCQLYSNFMPDLDSSSSNSCAEVNENNSGIINEDVTNIDISHEVYTDHAKPHTPIKNCNHSESPIDVTLIPDSIAVQRRHMSRLSYSSTEIPYYNDEYSPDIPKIDKSTVRFVEVDFPASNRLKMDAEIQPMTDKPKAVETKNRKMYDHEQTLTEENAQGCVKLPSIKLTGVDGITIIIFSGSSQINDATVQRAISAITTQFHDAKTSLVGKTYRYRNIIQPPLENSKYDSECTLNVDSKGNEIFEGETYIQMLRRLGKLPPSINDIYAMCDTLCGKKSVSNPQLQVPVEYSKKLNVGHVEDEVDQSKIGLCEIEAASDQPLEVEKAIEIKGIGMKKQRSLLDVFRSWTRIGHSSNYPPKNTQKRLSFFKRKTKSEALVHYENYGQSVKEDISLQNKSSIEEGPEPGRFNSSLYDPVVDRNDQLPETPTAEVSEFNSSFLENKNCSDEWFTSEPSLRKINRKTVGAWSPVYTRKFEVPLSIGEGDITMDSSTDGDIVFMDDSVAGDENLMIFGKAIPLQTRKTPKRRKRASGFINTLFRRISSRRTKEEGDHDVTINSVNISHHSIQEDNVPCDDELLVAKSSAYNESFCKNHPSLKTSKGIREVVDKEVNDDKTEKNIEGKIDDMIQEVIHNALKIASSDKLVDSGSTSEQMNSSRLDQSWLSSPCRLNVDDENMESKPSAHIEDHNDRYHDIMWKTENHMKQDIDDDVPSIRVNVFGSYLYVTEMRNDHIYKDKFGDECVEIDGEEWVLVDKSGQCDTTSSFMAHAEGECVVKSTKPIKKSFFGGLHNTLKKQRYNNGKEKDTSRKAIEGDVISKKNSVKYKLKNLSPWKKNKNMMRHASHYCKPGCHDEFPNRASETDEIVPINRNPIVTMNGDDLCEPEFSTSPYTHISPLKLPSQTYNTSVLQSLPIKCFQDEVSSNQPFCSPENSRKVNGDVELPSPNEIYFNDLSLDNHPNTSVEINLADALQGIDDIYMTNTNTKCESTDPTCTPNNSPAEIFETTNRQDSASLCNKACDTSIIWYDFQEPVDGDNKSFFKGDVNVNGDEELNDVEPTISEVSLQVNELLLNTSQNAADYYTFTATSPAVSPESNSVVQI